MENLNENRKKATRNIIALLALNLFAGTGSWENAAIQTIANHWTGVDIATIRLLTTLPFFACIPVMLICGALVGKKIKYRTCANLASLFTLLGGFLPFVFHPTWTAVLFCRILLGIGNGFFSVRNAALLRSVPLEEQAKYMGWCTTLRLIVNTAMQTLIGVLAKNLGWNAPFLVYLFALIPGVYIFFALREPTIENVPLKSQKDQPAAVQEQGKMTVRGWGFCIIQLLAIACSYPLLSTMSTMIVNKGLGDAAVAGTVLSCYTAVGFVINLFLGPIKKIFGKFSSPLCYVIAGVGIFMVLFTQNLPLIYLGTILAGLGLYINYSLLYVYQSNEVGPKAVAFATGALIAFNQMGVYCSNTWIRLCNAIFHYATEEQNALMGGGVMMLVLAVVFVVGGFAVEQPKYPAVSSEK